MIRINIQLSAQGILQCFEILIYCLNNHNLFRANLCVTETILVKTGNFKKNILLTKHKSKSLDTYQEKEEHIAQDILNKRQVKCNYKF